MLLVIPGLHDYVLSASLPMKTLTRLLPIRPGPEDLLTDMTGRPCDRSTEEIGNDVMRRNGKLTFATAIPALFEWHRHSWGQVQVHTRNKNHSTYRPGSSIKNAHFRDVVFHKIMNSQINFFFRLDLSWKIPEAAASRSSSLHTTSRPPTALQSECDTHRDFRRTPCCKIKIHMV